MATVSLIDMQESEKAGSNKSGRDETFCTRAQLLARTNRRGPLSQVLVNTHVLSKIIVATERLAAIRE